ncbi:MAG: sugar ABC transporter permease YjfF, partial [Clostridia bacterium]
MKKGRKLGNLSLLITIVLFVLLYTFGGVSYASRNFLTWQSFVNIFKDNAFLLIAAVGTTFVLIMGGIDISIASNVALTGMLTAFWLANGMPLWLVLPLALLVGTFAGFVMGYMIQVFKI